MNCYQNSPPDTKKKSPVRTTPDFVESDKNQNEGVSCLREIIHYDNSNCQAPKLNVSRAPQPYKNQIPIICLMLQANMRMASDPARYGSHHLIWLSLYSLKNNLKWEGRR